MTFFRHFSSYFRNIEGWLLIPLLGVAFWLRITHLGEQTLWLDETVHLIQAKNFLQNDNLLGGSDRNGILFTVLLAPVFSTFGVTVEGARWLSVAFGFGSLVLIYRISNRLFSTPIGLIALALAAFSPYLVFWSKMARNYSILVFFCLLFIVQILDLTGKDGKARLSLGKVVLLLLTVVAGFLSHYLMLLFVACAAVWLLASNRNNISIWAKNNLKLTAVAVATVAMLAVIAFFFLAVNKELLDWALPDWLHLRDLYGKAPWYSFSVYSNVLLHDWRFLWAFAVFGMAWLALKKQFLPLTFFICFLILPFFLLSFVFREPTAARYLIFIYPFFLILAAFGLYQTGTIVEEKTSKFFKTPNLALVASAMLMLPMFPLKNLKSVVEFSFSENNKPDSRIIECVFSDWKNSCDYLKNRLQKDDVVMATLPQIPSVYLDRSDIVSFRQLYFDYKQKKYVPNVHGNPAVNSAQTTQDLFRTVKNSKRGWFLADFYLEGVMTDPAARRFVFQNFHFFPAASDDGSVMLFGWDNERFMPRHQNIIIQVGRNDQASSRELTFQMPNEMMERPFFQMRYRTQFVESESEAAIEINGSRFPLSVSNQNSEPQLLEIPIKALRRGQNVFKFLYNGVSQKEKFKGYVIYYVEFVS